MAVYKQTYKDYRGPRTMAWSRFLILMRFSYVRLFQSKFLVLFMAVCLFYPLGCALYIYLGHNSPLLAALKFRSGAMPEVDGDFFFIFSAIQGSLAFLLTTLIGPNLIAPDLANGALSLYLSRPFSRAQYVAGKMTVLLVLLSAITWIPGLLLYLIQVGCVGWTWGSTHLWLAGGILFGLWIWILVLALIALALSAWVKWKIAGGALILGVFFAGAGFGTAINGVLHTHYGDMIHLTKVIHTLWLMLYRCNDSGALTITEAWTSLGTTCLLCLFLLTKRIRAFEVVK